VGLGWWQMRKIVSSITRRLFPPSQTIEGYEHSELVDVIFRKTLAYRPDGEWREMAGSSSVLDFGGGCGLHYKQAGSSTVRWAIVETPVMVARATELATDRLRFFTSIDEAADWLGPIDVMHSNGALQYVDNPYSILQQLCALRSKRMLWYRVFLSPDIEKKDLQSSLLGDNGPGSIPVTEKNVRYVRTAIPEQAFLDAHESYKLEERGPDWFRYNVV
jgi:putative methyltransferase (TIGR04325 family)